jgi:anti-sigma-K factor RskA
LEERDLRLVERHLSGCPVCRAEVAELREAAANLSFLSPQVEPPTRLKRQIMDRVSPVQNPRRGGFGQWLRNLQPAWGVAALAVIALLVISNLVLWQQVRTLADKTPQSFQVASLTGLGSSPDGRAVMIVTQNGRFGTLVVDKLPELGSSKQYQLWLVLDSERTSGGVFSVDRYGYGAMVIHAPRPLNEYTSFGVTVEPTGGSPAPTGEKVLGGEF